jgi:hypothetical protein
MMLGKRGKHRGAERASKTATELFEGQFPNQPDPRDDPKAGRPESLATAAPGARGHAGAGSSNYSARHRA